MSFVRTTLVGCFLGGLLVSHAQGQIPEHVKEQLDKLTDAANLRTETDFTECRGFPRVLHFGD